jgi:hypothetical protein
MDSRYYGERERISWTEGVMSKVPTARLKATLSVSPILP